jgi:fatty acid/phospholipid biosynthesis enzyme
LATSDTTVAAGNTAAVMSAATCCAGHDDRSRNHRKPVGLHPMATNGLMP